jgi:uncharacterized protein
MSGGTHDWLEGLLRAESTPPPGYERRFLRPSPLPDESMRIDTLAPDISGRCNLACRYCAEASTQPGNRSPMSVGTLENILSFVRAQGGRSFSLRFGSGEPLLNRELLHELQERLDHEYPAGTPGRPEVFITTNGTLLDDGEIGWLASTGWHVKVSIDGPGEVHDRWRVTPGGQGTYARVSEAVRRLASLMPERFSVTAVLAAGNDPALVFAGLEALGAHRIELVPAAHDDPETLPGLREVRRFREFVEAYVERLAEEGSLAPRLVRLVNRVPRLMGYDLGYVHCGAGRNFFGVSPEGELYPCFRFIGVDGYRMGNVGAGVDPSAAEAFRNGAGRPWDRRDDCEGCWAAPLCGGPCFAVSELSGKRKGEPMRLHCAYSLIESHGAWKLVEKLRQRDPARLLEFLPPSLRDYAQAPGADGTA